MGKRLLEKPDVWNSLPSPLVLATCADEAGKANVITLAWVGITSTQPPTVSISVQPHTYSYPLIKASGEFVLSICTEALLKETDYCGIVSGKDVDKWEKTGLVALPATRVKAPLIAQSPINLECVVRHILHLGSHDAFVAEVVAAHVDEGLLGEGGGLDAAKVYPLILLCRDYWALGGKTADVGRVGRSR